MNDLTAFSLAYLLCISLDSAVGIRPVLHPCFVTSIILESTHTVDIIVPVRRHLRDLYFLVQCKIVKINKLDVKSIKRRYNILYLQNTLAFLVEYYTPLLQFASFKLKLQQSSS